MRNDFVHRTEHSRTNNRTEHSRTNNGGFAPAASGALSRPGPGARRHSRDCHSTGSRFSLWKTSLSTWGSLWYLGLWMGRSGSVLCPVGFSDYGHSPRFQGQVGLFSTLLSTPGLPHFADLLRVSNCVFPCC